MALPAKHLAHILSVLKIGLERHRRFCQPLELGEAELLDGGFCNFVRCESLELVVDKLGAHLSLFLRPSNLLPTLQ